MSRLNFIGSFTVSPGNTTPIQVPAGRYAGIMVRLTGTTDTGQTLANADIGTLRVQRSGRQIHSETWQFYADLNNLYGGYPEATFPTAGATATSCIIPFSLPDANLPNSMFVANETELFLYLDALSTLATRFGANAITLTVYGIEEEQFAETYELQVAPTNQTAGGAGTLKLNVPGNNIALLLMRDSGGIVTSVTVEIDGSTLVPNISDAVLLAYTNAWLARVETSGNTLIAIPTSFRKGDVGAFGNLKTEVTTVFSGSGTFYMTTLQLQAPPAGRAAASQVAAEQTRTARGARLRGGVPSLLGPPQRQ